MAAKALMLCNGSISPVNTLNQEIRSLPFIEVCIISSGSNTVDDNNSLMTSEQTLQ